MPPAPERQACSATHHHFFYKNTDNKEVNLSLLQVLLRLQLQPFITSSIYTRWCVRVAPIEKEKGKKITNFRLEHLPDNNTQILVAFTLGNHGQTGVAMYQLLSRSSSNFLPPLSNAKHIRQYCCQGRFNMSFRSIKFKKKIGEI